MKRAKIRKHTEDSLLEICKQYRTRTELQTNDPSVYKLCLERGHDFLDRACSHMLKINSIPQLVCKVILEGILKTKCVYNSRKIISPYELDIYFPEFKLAVEYNGKRWHSKPEVFERDELKAEMCKKMGITLIVLEEGRGKYENNIKTDIVNCLDVINLCCDKQINSAEVRSVDLSSIFDDIIAFKSPESIKKKIDACRNIAEFQRRFPNEYLYLRSSNSSHLLEEIRERYEATLEDLKQECLKISCYSDFLSNHYNLYQKCYKRGVLKKFSSHMTRSPRARHALFSDEELINKSLKLNPRYKTDIFDKNRSLFIEIEKRGIDWKKCLNA